MQTLQTARLTSKPVVAKPVPQSSSHLNPNPSQPQQPSKSYGILRKRFPQYPEFIDYSEIEPDPPFTAKIARFFASVGLPYDTINDVSFRDLFSESLPPIAKISKSVEQQCTPGRQLVNNQRIIGPISVTLDVVGDEDDKFLAFSIHYFEDLYERKNVVYLRKLLLSTLESETILNIIRRAFTLQNYNSVRITNIVSPNKQVQVLLLHSDSVKRHFVCFHDYISRFIRELMDIPEFSIGLNQMRQFVRFVRQHIDIYSKFRRMRLAADAHDLNIPAVDDGSWHSIFVFLTECLALHETFTHFTQRLVQVSNYIDGPQFVHLVHFQRILEQCAKHCEQLSAPNNSMSQVVPAIMALRNFISRQSTDNGYVKTIKQAFSTTFEEVVNSPLHLRYDISTLLDPRFGYREHIYPLDIWRSLESKIIEEFVDLGECSRNILFHEDISTWSRTERKDAILRDIVAYRRLTTLERAEKHVSPNYWWGSREMEMEYLAVIAREYLASPAMSIDAAHFFGAGGKYTRLCKLYKQEDLEMNLTLAGTVQNYRGKGAGYTAKMTAAMCNAIDYSYNKISSVRVEKVNFPVPLLQEKPPTWNPRKNPVKTAPIVKPEEQKPQDLLPVSAVSTVSSEDLTDKIKLEEPEVEEKPMEQHLEHHLEQPMEQPLEQPMEQHTEPPLTPQLAIKYVLMPKRTVPKIVVNSAEKEVKEEPEDQPLPPPPRRRILMPVAVQRTRPEAVWIRPRSDNRRCSVCHQLEHRVNVKSVTIESERLLIMAGCVLRNEYTIEQACEFMLKEQRMYICHVHFAETVDEIYRLLKVAHYSEIERNCSKDSLENALSVVQMLRPRATVPMLKGLMSKFCERACKLYPYLEPVVHSPEKLWPDPSGSPEPADTNEILPKKSRMPRKQVLESSDGPDNLVKVIEQTPFELPPLQPYDVGDEIQCCFCTKKPAREDGFLKVPRSEDRLARWIDKIGPEFEARIQRGRDNYICRSHFAPDAFSSRGRLLKGMLPLVEPEKVEVTYRIRQNGDFQRLSNGEQKPGTSARIDLETLGRDYEDCTRELSEDDEEEEPEEEDCDQDFKPSRSRKRQWSEGPSTRSGPVRRGSRYSPN